MTLQHLQKISAALITTLALLLSGCGENQVKENHDDQVKTLDQLIYSRARESFLVGKYKTAVTLFEPLAAKGNDEAQYTLGYCYYNGLGVDKDLDKAMQWFKKSAKQNNLNAMTSLSLIQTAIKQQDEQDSVTEENTTATNTAKEVVDLRGVIKPEEKVAVAPKPVTPVYQPVKPVPVLPVVEPLPEPMNDPVEQVSKVETIAADGFIAPDEEQSSEWILKQPPANYTIQLASNTRKRSILNFIKTIPLDGVYFYSNKQSDPVRYHVIHGSFQGIKQATAKLKRLQERGHKNAWIRNMKDVQGFLIIN